MKRTYVVLLSLGVAHPTRASAQIGNPGAIILLAPALVVSTITGFAAAAKLRHPSCCAAMTPSSELRLRLRTNDRVESLEGVLLAVDRDSLTVANQQMTQRIDRRVVEEAFVRGRESMWAEGWALGLISGAVIGAAVGYHSSSGCCNGAGVDTRMVDARFGAINGAIVGPLGGAIVGAFVRTDRWQRARLVDAHASIEPIPAGGLGVRVIVPF